MINLLFDKKPTNLNTLNTSNNKTIHLLLGITGSVAAIKIPEILQSFHSEAKLEDIHLEIKCVATKSAMHFLSEDFHKQLITDDFEWNEWNIKGDPIVHIELRNWADIFVIVPLDANTMAKISHGICDNLLTCVVRAWDFKKPIAVCPAMNTMMYEHPLTLSQLDILSELNFKILEPISKELACGDIGIGALQTPQNISKFVFEILKNQ